VDRHVLARGSQEKVVENITRKEKEERPDLIVLTPTCTSSILQEDLQNFVNRAVNMTPAGSSEGQQSSKSKTNVLFADVNHYRINEFQAADRTFEQIVRYFLPPQKKRSDFAVDHENGISSNGIVKKTAKISANILGIFTL
jgi:light-independent protochlorophyllide reductase subunit B